MNKAIMVGLVALLGVTGCATKKLDRERYKITDLTVVIDSYEGINRSYQIYTMGTRPDDKVLGFQVGDQIYSVRGDNETLGHELRHILEGSYHD